MPNPKKKTSKSKRNMRRSHDRVPVPPVTLCSCGGATLPHCICPSCGSYRGRQYVSIQEANAE